MSDYEEKRLEEELESLGSRKERLFEDARRDGYLQMPEPGFYTSPADWWWDQEKPGALPAYGRFCEKLAAYDEQEYEIRAKLRRAKWGPILPNSQPMFGRLKP